MENGRYEIATAVGQLARPAGQPVGQPSNQTASLDCLAGSPPAPASRPGQGRLACWPANQPPPLPFPPFSTPRSLSSSASLPYRYTFSFLSAPTLDQMGDRFVEFLSLLTHSHYGVLVGGDLLALESYPRLRRGIRYADTVRWRSRGAPPPLL